MVVIVADGDLSKLSGLPDESVRLLVFIPRVYNTYRVGLACQQAQRVLCEGGSAIVARSVLEARGRL